MMKYIPAPSDWLIVHIASLIVFGISILLMFGWMAYCADLPKDIRKWSYWISICLFFCGLILSIFTAEFVELYK